MLHTDTSIFCERKLNIVWDVMTWNPPSLYIEPFTIFIDTFKLFPIDGQGQLFSFTLNDRKIEMTIIKKRVAHIPISIQWTVQLGWPVFTCINWKRRSSQCQRRCIYRYMRNEYNSKRHIKRTFNSFVVGSRPFGVQDNPVVNGSRVDVWRNK